MDEKNLDILDSIISIKQSTNDFLEQKILENENSFDIFDTNFQLDNNEINKNNINLSQKVNIDINNNTNNNQIEKIKITKVKNENNINGQNNDALSIKNRALEKESS